MKRYEYRGQIDSILSIDVVFVSSRWKMGYKLTHTRHMAVSQLRTFYYIGLTLSSNRGGPDSVSALKMMMQGQLNPNSEL